jgi:hypothetical protein
MDPHSLMLAQNAFNAYALRGVMVSTCQTGETEADAELRHAAIVELFRTFEAADAMEATLACHCISLRFMLEAAMRDAGTVDPDPARQMRLRASAMAIGKNLHLWLRMFERLHERNEARAVESVQRAGQPEAVAAPAKPELPATNQLPVDQDEPHPMAAQSSRLPEPLVFPLAGSAESGAMALLVADPPGLGMKQTLLSTAAISQEVISQATSRGMLTDGTFSLTRATA